VEHYGHQPAGDWPTALNDVAYSGQAILEGPIFIRATLERDNLNLGGLTTSREVNH